MQPKNVAIRKRTQVAMTNKFMFIWVAVASVLFGFALVASIFLAQMSFYNEKVLAEKQKTITNLDNNKKAVTDLESNVRILDTNQLLMSLKSQPDDRAVQVILDALPSDANSSALGASVQNKLLSGIEGLSLISLQVDPVVGVESSSSSSSYDSSTSSASQYVINFRFSVSGNETALKKALSNLEASIRTIDIVSLKIEGRDTEHSIMTVQARSYYEPAQAVELKDKVIKS
jgi:hypothetical protein